MVATKDRMAINRAREWFLWTAQSYIRVLVFMMFRCVSMSKTRLAYCGMRGAYGQEETNKLGNACLFVGGPVNCERKEWVVTINDEHQSNSNSWEKAAQDPRRTSRRQQQRQRQRQRRHERLHHYSPQGMDCLFCCEKESMVVVLFVSMTSNVRRSMSVETRMVVYCAKGAAETDGIQTAWWQFTRCPRCRYRFLFNSDIIRLKRSIMTATR